MKPQDFEYTARKERIVYRPEDLPDNKAFARQLIKDFFLIIAAGILVPIGVMLVMYFVNKGLID